MSTAATDADLRDLAANVLDETSRELALDSSDQSQQVRDLGRDYRQAVGEILEAGDQLGRDLAELGKKRDLLPAEGYKRLRTEAMTEAEQRHRQADKRAGKLLEQLREQLISDALPKLDPKREALARDELALLIGDAQGNGVAQRLVDLAHTGSREALAVAVGTTFGRSLLETRGLKGRAYVDAIKSVRLVAAANATTKSTSPREIIASATLRSLGGLGAARGAAGGYVLNVLRYGP